MSLLVAYVCGVLTIPVLIGIWSATIWSTSRDIGSGGCGICDHLPEYEIGDKTNIESAIRSAVHRLIWARTRWHRIARGNEWRELKARGVTRTWHQKYML